MHKIAEQRRRFGYRRVGIMLERKGMIMNEKKLSRRACIILGLKSSWSEAWAATGWRRRRTASAAWLVIRHGLRLPARYRIYAVKLGT